MQPDQAADFVAGILTRQNVEFGTRDDGRQHRLLVGSTALFIGFDGWGDDDTVISISGLVLENLNVEEDGAILAILQRINDINCNVYFGKFCLYGNSIRAEHDLLASRLQGDELMNALGVIARLADDWDDKLREELGGKTWAQAEEEVAQQDQAIDT